MLKLQDKLKAVAAAASTSLPTWAKVPGVSIPVPTSTGAAGVSGCPTSPANSRGTEDAPRASLDAAPIVEAGPPALSTAEVLDALDPAFFSEGFDVVQYAIQHLLQGADACTPEALRANEEELMRVLEVASGAVNAHVLENYSDFVAGIKLVAELQDELTCSHVVVRNGRRFLSRAHAEVHANLRIADLNRKKGKLMQVLEIGQQLQMAHDIEESMRSTLNEGSFAKAIRHYLEGHHMLATRLQGLACQGALRVLLVSSFRTLAERLDARLGELCVCFEGSAAGYSAVLEAYTLMLDVGPGDAVELKPLDVKLQESFAAAVDRETDGVLLAYTLTMDRASSDASDALMRQRAAGVRTQYKEMCRHLAAENFHRCLLNTLEVLYNILKSHFQMMQWHLDPPALQAPEDKPLGRQALALPALAGSDLPTTAPPTTTDDEPGASVGDAVVSSDEQPSHEDEEERLRAHCRTIGVAMSRHARTIWEMAAMRVGMLLNAPAAPDGSQFLEVLTLTQKFIDLGEAFTGAEAANLRGHVAKTTATFFAAKQHRQLDVLKMMLDRELWQRVPGEAVAPLAAEMRRAVTHAGAAPAPALPTGNPIGGSMGSGDGGVKRSSSDGDSKVGGRGGDVQRPRFAAFLQRGNPFSSRPSAQEPASTAATGAAAGTEAASLGTSGLAVQQEEDDDDDELQGDYIDEDSQRASCSVGKGDSTHGGGGGPGGGVDASLDGAHPTITAASVHVLRSLAEYVCLIRALGQAGGMVLAAVVQLFSCYFLHVFRTFGKQDALAAGSYDLTPRLQQTLLRLIESGMGAPGAPSQTAPGGLSGASRSCSGDASSFTSSGNLYGLKERCTAAASLHTVAAELKRTRTVLDAHLGSGCAREVEQFYARTVDAVEDLCEHIYREAARLLLNLHWLPEEIGDSDKLGSTKKYDRREVGMQRNLWVDKLLMELKQYVAKVKIADVSPKTTGLLWEYASETIAAALVQGFSRVRKCSEMGRASMAMDAQAVTQWLQTQMAPHGREPNLRIVENYIKAFYTPDKDLVHWAMTHPEYTREQIIALVNQVATSYNWKRSHRSEILAQIEQALM